MKRIVHLVAGLSWLLLLAACNPSPPAAETKPAAAEPQAHSHGAGPHAGTLTDWGGGKYHVEFTVDHDKKEATIYILGSDEKSPVPVQAANVVLSINDPAFEVALKPQPLEGEPAGAASRYTGGHENLGIVREFAGTISGEIEGTPYTGDFKEEPHAADQKH